MAKKQPEWRIEQERTKLLLALERLVGYRIPGGPYYDAGVAMCYREVHQAATELYWLGTLSQALDKR